MLERSTHKIAQCGVTAGCCIYPPPNNQGMSPPKPTILGHRTWVVTRIVVHRCINRIEATDNMSAVVALSFLARRRWGGVGGEPSEERGRKLV